MQIQALGHVVLKVRDLERSVRFYGEVLGLRLVARAPVRGSPMAFFAIAHQHHDLALREVGAAALHPEPEETGLAHVAFRIGNRMEQLREACAWMDSCGIEVVYAADHRVSQSIYVNDPDGNRVELYVDADPALWAADPAAVACSEPLRLDR